MAISSACRAVVALLFTIANAPWSPSGGAEVTERLWMKSTTTAYKEATLKLLIQDANRIARALRLDEDLPITTNKLAEAILQSPCWSDYRGSFGSISTSRYHYVSSEGNKITSVAMNYGGDSGFSYRNSLFRKYMAPKSQMDTNAAYALAVEFLLAADIDAQALKRESVVITVSAIDFGEKYVPMYSICWGQPYSLGPEARADPQDGGLGNAVEMEVVLPERKLVSLNVHRPPYIKRPALEVPDRERLLQQTDDEVTRKMWFTTQAYRSAALDVMIREANQVARSLRAAETLPITESSLTKVDVATPFIRDSLGRFGAIYTTNYSYGFAGGSKLSSVALTLPSGARQWGYYSSMKERYALPWSQVKTNSAHELATNWLAAVSVDIVGMERDCLTEVVPWDIGKRFVPIYRLAWWRKDKPRQSGKVAGVELFEPGRQLIAFWVNDPKYVSRKALSVPKEENLLRPSANRN